MFCLMVELLSFVATARGLLPSTSMRPGVEMVLPLILYCSIPMLENSKCLYDAHCRGMTTEESDTAVSSISLVVLIVAHIVRFMAMHMIFISGRNETGSPFGFVKLMLNDWSIVCGPIPVQEMASLMVDASSPSSTPFTTLRRA